MWDTLIIEPMVNVLLWIYSAVGGNFGLAIILFTILMRLLTHPLMVQQIKGATAMQNLQTNEKYIALQKKYKDDKEKLAQEQMKLYQELGINPFASCLPTLIQLPIIFGLYQVVTRAMAVTPMQLADLSGLLYPFIDFGDLIPLNTKFMWMENLSQPERLYIFGFGLPVLAILVVITTYLQQKLMAMPTSNPNDPSAQTMQSMNTIMPLMMGYFSYSYAAGLALYFVASNLTTVVQYAALGKVNWNNILPSNLFASKASAKPTKKKS